MTNRGTVYFKYKDFKKAVVYFKNSLKNVGIGLRVPELEEQELNNNMMDQEDYSEDDGVPQQKQLGDGAPHKQT
eukprot:scaffold6594_cov162-Amphora_coffeaeformis.AAC.11